MPLRSLESDSFKLSTCDVGEEDCATTFSFSKKAKLRLFQGAPVTVPTVARAVRAAA